jgi:hypothetical protein
MEETSKSGSDTAMSGQLLRRLASRTRVHDAPLGARRRMLLKTVDREGSLCQSLTHALSGEAE